MMTLTREDFQRLETKLDDFGRELNLLAQTVAILKTQLETRPVYAQPCEFLKEHMALHQSFLMDWRRAVIQFLLGLFLAGICGLFGYMIRDVQERVSHLPVKTVQKSQQEAF